MKFLMIFAFIFSITMTSCTLNMIMTDTHGTAEDVVDSNPSATADVKPVVNIPMTPLAP